MVKIKTMRPALTFLFACAAHCALAQDSQSELKTALPGQWQPEHHLSKAEQSGWQELISERTTHSATFTDGNKKISYSSTAAVNFASTDGSLIPVDTRPIETNNRWEAMQQPEPVLANLDGSFVIGKATAQLPVFSKTISINGVQPTFGSRIKKDGQFLWFNNVAPGVSKQLIFGQGVMKYNYVLESVPSLENVDWVVKEIIRLPTGAKVVSNKNKKDASEPELFVLDENGKLLGAIHPLVCFDHSGKSVIGQIEIVMSAENETTVALKVPGSWLTSTDRIYPVIVDPLVTGTATTWTGGTFPSCFFPTYHSDPVLTITVPAAISVTHLGLTTNFYASPFSTSVMADGRMYFSTDCGQTNVFQVQPPEGALAGTAYMEDFNLMSPLMCCHPQQCTSFTIDVRMHLSRTSNGPDCNTNFIYYDPFSLWPFSCYAEGYTPEAYGQRMNFSPSSTVCANDCEVNARIYARYGVPPYTFGHPWSSETVVAGVPAGCSTGNMFGLVPLDIPNCPNNCDPSTSLSVPPPIVTDACGTSVVLYDPSYNLNIKPVAELVPAVDTLLVCSGNAGVVVWNSCLPNATIQWEGNGTGGNSATIDTVYTNTSSTPQFLTYLATPTLDGCTGPVANAVVQINPLVNQDFSVDPDPVIVTNTVTFQEVSNLNGNNLIGYVWGFGVGTDGSNEPSPTYVYNEPGEYEVCFDLVTIEGCSGVFCRMILVVPAELVLPNIMTPNGDDINDALVIQYIDSYENNQLMVFNRWGNMVYEKSKYANDWKAVGLEDGVYFYTVSLPNGKEYSSSLQIKR